MQGGRAGTWPQQRRLHSHHARDRGPCPRYRGVTKGPRGSLNMCGLHRRAMRGASLTRPKRIVSFPDMSASRYFVGIALAFSIITPSWAAQRTVLKSLTACPYVKDFTDWFEAMEKGNSSRAFELIDGKGCIEVTKGDLVEFERLLTHPFAVCVRPIGQWQCFWTSPFAILPARQKR
jgi:hypothetical protein